MVEGGAGATKGAMASILPLATHQAASVKTPIVDGLRCGCGSRDAAFENSPHRWYPEGMTSVVGSLRLSIDAETELVPLNCAGAPEFMALIDRSRPYLREWLAWLDSTRTLAELEGFIDSTTRELAEGKGYALWIRHRGTIVGIVHLREISQANRKATIGYWVGEQHRGRGFARRATRAICDYGFRQLGLNRIEIRCATGNTASQAVPVALGFQREGVLRDNECLYDHFVDHVVYGMLAGEWAQLKG